MVLLSLTGPIPGVDICRDRKLVGREIILMDVARGLFFSSSFFDVIKRIMLVMNGSAI